MPFPPAHMLVGAALAEVARSTMRRPPPRAAVWAVGAALAVLPDVDIVLGILMGRGGSLHGTFTHSAAAVAVWALLGHALGGWRWGVIAGAAYGSHLVVDLLDESGPTNLMLGWPFTGTRPYALGRVFPKVPVGGDGPVDTLRNVLQPDALVLLAHQTLLAAAVAAGLVALAAGIRWWRRMRAAGRGGAG